MKTNEEEMIEQENNEQEKMEKFLNLSHYESYIRDDIEKAHDNPVIVKLARELIQKFPNINVWLDIMYQICTDSQPKNVVDYTINEKHRHFIVYYDYKHPTNNALDNPCTSSTLYVDWRADE